MSVLDKPIASIDIESTGVDPVKDYIVQFGVCVLHPDGTRTRWETLIKPPIPIPAEASALHGITDESVKDSKPFAEYARVIVAGLRDKHLLGYNLRGLDLPILDEELRRCGLKLDLPGVTVIDCFSVFCNREPRDLSAAVRKFAGRDHEGAHGALADAEATVDVFLGQQSAYDIGFEEMAALSIRDADKLPIDLAGKLYRDKDGDACYSFGKSRGMKVKDDTGFAYWMLGKDFSESTKEALREELDRVDGLRAALAEALNG